MKPLHRQALRAIGLGTTLALAFTAYACLPRAGFGHSCEREFRSAFIIGRYAGQERAHWTDGNFRLNKWAKCVKEELFARYHQGEVIDQPLAWELGNICFDKILGDIG